MNIYRIFGSKHSHHYQDAFFKGHHYKTALIPFPGALGGALRISADLKITIDTNLPLQMLNAALANNPALLARSIQESLPDQLTFTNENFDKNYALMKKCFQECYNDCINYCSKIKPGKLSKEDIDYELAASYFIMITQNKNNMPWGNHFCYNENKSKLYPTAFKKLQLLEENYQYFQKTYSNFEFYWGDCREFMKQWDTPDTIIVMDPPYGDREPDYRGESKIKGTQDDIQLHKDIADFAKNAKGTVFINYQPHPLVHKLYHDKEFIHITKRRHCRFSNTYKQELMIFKNHQISTEVLVDYYSKEVSKILSTNDGGRKHKCREFRLKAVEAYNTGMFTIREVMAMFKIKSATTLRNWRLKVDDIKDIEYNLKRLKVLLGKKQLRAEALHHLHKLRNYKVSYNDIISFTTSKKRKYSYRELKSFLNGGKWPKGKPRKNLGTTPPNGPDGTPPTSESVIRLISELLLEFEILHAA